MAGHADRSCFDLSRHAEKTNVELNAARALKEPRKVEYIQVTVNKQSVGKTFKKDSKTINDYVEKLSEAEKQAYCEQMAADKKIKLEVGAGFELSEDQIQFEKKEKTVILD